MELVLASSASKPRKAVVGGMNDTITYWALLDTFKFLVEIAFPCLYSFC
jgi:hypothetical protein